MRVATVSLSDGFVSVTVRLLSRTEAEPEGFVIENLLAVAPDRTMASF